MSHPMRKLIEAVKLGEMRGMNAVKAVLSQQIEAEQDQDDTETKSLLDQWGILDDMWITESGGLMLYREIRLKQPWQNNLKRNGHSYWSTSRRGAHPYDASTRNLKDTVDVTIIAELPANSTIDWADLWETHLGRHHVGEDEVRLSNVPLIIRYIYVDGKEVQSPWIGKKVIA